MASQQCCKPAQNSQHDQHQHQHQQDHCFGHVSDKIKGVFQGHHHGQGPAVAHGHHQGHGPAVAHGHSGHGSGGGNCNPAGLKKKKEHRKNKEGGLMHKIKEAFSDHSSDSSDDECHKRKN